MGSIRDALMDGPIVKGPCLGCIYHDPSALSPSQACYSCGLDYKNHTGRAQKPHDPDCGRYSCYGMMCQQKSCRDCYPSRAPQKPQDCEDMPEATPTPQTPSNAILEAPGKPQGAIVNPKELAGAKKAPIWQVLPRWVILLVGRVMQVGAAKYGAFNYRDSNVWAMTYVDAIERHMQLWQDGENDDPETGVSHLAHVIAGCAILLDAQANGKLGDDRPVTGQVRKALDLIDRLRETHPMPAPQY